LLFRSLSGRGGRKIGHMRWSLAVLLLCLASFAVAQQPSDTSPDTSQDTSKADREKAKARDAEAGESSSRETRIDLSPPKDDAKDHPNSGNVIPPPDVASDVQELHQWNPYRAGKDDEVGDYYFKRKNYKAALARYQDALIYKENDAIANFRLGECYEKLEQPADAIPHYQEYLRILPQGPLSKDARKALKRLGAPEKPAEKASTSQPSDPSQ